MVTLVGARELKTRLGRYLRDVRGGATIVVTERGQPVAELRPLSATNDDTDTRWREAAARGEVALGDGDPMYPCEPITHRGAPLGDAIDGDREDRL